MTAEIGLVHVVYAPYGVAPLQRFMDSYRQHPAGTDHQLILVCKAFEAETLPMGFQAAVNGVAHQALFVPDGGFDLGSYFHAARACEHRLLCFTNSSSEILADDWLAKLAAALTESGVGLAGATGSHESHSSQLWHHLLRSFPKRRLRWGIDLLRRFPLLLEASRDFPCTPNFHLRTNVFLAERQQLLGLDAGPFLSKEDCHRFESGRRGLTETFRRAGLEPRVVDRHGRAWRPERWQESHTFRAGVQEGLLVADNRTRDYQEADEAQRRLLAQMAWGD